MPRSVVPHTESTPFHTLISGTAKFSPLTPLPRLYTTDDINFHTSSTAAAAAAAGSLTGFTPAAVAALKADRAGKGISGTALRDALSDPIVMSHARRQMYGRQCAVLPDMT